MTPLHSANLWEDRGRAQGVPLRLIGGSKPIDGRPLSLGVPLSIGLVYPGVRWGVFGTEGSPRVAQTKVLATWPDGSIKWLFVVFLGTDSWLESSSLFLRPLEPGTKDEVGAASSRELRVDTGPSEVSIDTGEGQFRIRRGQDQLFCEGGSRDPRWLDPSGCRLLYTDSRGRQGTARIETLHVTESGPVRVQVAIAGKLGHHTGLRFSGDISCYAGSNLIRLRITLQNPRRARHPGGYWDLGDPGSIMLQDLSLELVTQASTGRRIAFLEAVGAQPSRTSGDFLEIYQDSSGGENWKSRNHINREGRIPVTFRGCRVRTQEGVGEGLRASPVASLGWDQKQVSIALEEFWQQFPSAIEIEGERLTARLLPKQFGDLHEIQGGEHNTRVLWIELGSAEEAATSQDLSWIHDPPTAIPDPAWIAASGVLPFFPSPEADRRIELRSLLHDALDGDRSFFAKREVIDEFGWRHFGDMWADHEEAYSPDPSPVISHYNNQYDLLYGLLVEHLATGDRRWWQLVDPLARHLMDIDIYHTDRDKPAYNGGLFWHTAHYLDAGGCTHRTMSRSMVGKPIAALGGGPASEHNYSSGLLLYHYLTGSLPAKAAVTSLADWVVAMDDGTKHVFGVLSGRPTGNASRTGGYHGPGRGAGNSINALLDGWLATGEGGYLAKLEELVRRSIHPSDDVESLDLGNAEWHWSYTVHLQALVRFVEMTRDRPGLDDLRSYVLAALHRYGRWMADNESFYLDEPEQLEYPTETWAAQELRKGTTLWMAARHAPPEDREHFRNKGTELLERAWQSLSTFESRICTRPLALVLQQGYLETFLAEGLSDPDKVSGPGGLENEIDFGPVSEFVEQRQYLRSLSTSPWKLLGSLQHALRPSRWIKAARQTWLFERLRWWGDRFQVG